MESLSSVLNRELPPNKDFPDLRLSKVFNAWTDFATIHREQIAQLGTLSTTEVVATARELSISMSNVLAIEVGGVVSEQKITQLTDAVSGEGNKVIFMRHGEQNPPDWVQSISDPRLKKIRMMQDPLNEQDLLTDKGMLDAVVTAFGLLYIALATGKRVHIFSSENARAKEVAAIISVVVPSTTFAEHEGLSCITYKNESDQPPATIDALLQAIPSGFSPWERSLVDTWCRPTKSGVEPSRAITEEIEGLINMGTGSGTDLFIALTHNQQLAEALRQTNQLDDPSIRLPELTMIVLGQPDNSLVLEKGVLDDVAQRIKPTSMRSLLERLGAGYEWYKIRRGEFETGQKIPFLTCPQPLYLSQAEGNAIKAIGHDVVDLIGAAHDLYEMEGVIRELLDRGKPDFFKKRREPRYLFVRPDLLITEQGLSVCEIETSPFGLALAELLNRAYRESGFDTMVQSDILSRFVVKNTSRTGTIIYSPKTSSYAGQLNFLAEEVFSGSGRQWQARAVDHASENRSIYRGFYLHESLTSPDIHDLVNGKDGDDFIPSLTPHLEEKALLALIWDKRWAPYLEKQLGVAAFNNLRTVIPPTWIVGQEQYFEPGLPSGVSSLEGLAGLPKSRRGFVLKQSGFGSKSSWAEGVVFLQEKSVARVAELLTQARADETALYIVQEFKAGQKRPMTYETADGTLGLMQAKIRVTPYFSAVLGNAGDLVAIKATGCENTNYIHASTASINTAVAVSS